MSEILKLFPIPKPGVGETLLFSGVAENYEAFALAKIMESHVYHVHIVRNDIRLETVSSQLAVINPSLKILKYPTWDCLPYDRVSPSKNVMGERLSTLTSLAQGSNQPTILITSIAAFLQRIPKFDKDLIPTIDIKVGQNLSQPNIVSTLALIGYRRVETVHEAAEFAVRGGLIDIFPTGHEYPYRIDFFGDEIESIRQFDPLSQRSMEKALHFQILPASEVLLNSNTIRCFRENFRALFPKNAEQDPLYVSISEGHSYSGMEHWLPFFYPEMVNLSYYLPTKTTISFEANIMDAVQNRLNQIQEYYEARQQFAHKNATIDVSVYQPIPPERLFLQASELTNIAQKTGCIEFTPFNNPSANYSFECRALPDFAPLRTQSNLNLIEALIHHLRTFMTGGAKIVIACQSQGSCERLAAVLREHHFHSFEMIEEWKSLVNVSSSKICLLPFEIENGFVTPTLIVITEQDIFGERHTRVRKKRRRADLFIHEAGSLSAGDYVVHSEHGIGRYEGLHTLTVNNVPHDCVYLIYEGGDKLFVPVENLELLSRYGGENSSASLDRLGSTAWQVRKAKVKKKLFDIAHHLMNIAAARKLQKGEILVKPEALYEEFTARFAYTETEDQLRSIEETMEDLASGRPMDRLICGDVGFGKTEVAMRAAFVVASQGKQVVLIAPTTLLCRQHYRNFSERLQGFGLRIGHLSRLVPARDLKLTKAALECGEIDIVIGTHGLLSSSTKFKDVGLFIIDEEQHFGVKQKERLKEIKSDVHILTLSATPIPRTLQMALTGVKDMSLITTPPVDRLAVRTFVLPYDPVVIREAIIREHFRGGQIFYVCPHIEDLDIVAQELKELVPEIKMAILHGQMPASTLETLMLDFYDKKFELLLSTNIIESGLDLPSVNTIIIHRSDLFGLAQLYQLRGRVGRTKIRGYAYLTIPNYIAIGPIAQKRLEVMQTLDTLGAGFQLASHDMDIRGTGNLIGSQQSGHIREVGVELYQQMLDEAVTLIQAQENKGEQDIILNPSWIPQINIDLPVLLPGTYIADLAVKLSLYRRLSHLSSDEEINDFRAELVDRFGSLPEEAENLLDLMRIKQWCRQTGIEKIDTGDKGAVITLHQNTFKNPSALLNYIQLQKGTAFIRPDQKIVMIRSWPHALDRKKGITKIVREFLKLVA